MNEKLSDLDNLIDFLDRKISRLRRHSTPQDQDELENEISIWKKKRNELNDLQVKLVDEQIKTLAV